MIALSGFLAETCYITFLCLNDGQLKVQNQQQQEGNSTPNTGLRAPALTACWVMHYQGETRCRKEGQGF